MQYMYLKCQDNTGNNIVVDNGNFGNAIYSRNTNLGNRSGPGNKLSSSLDIWGQSINPLQEITFQRRFGSFAAWLKPFTNGGQFTANNSASQLYYNDGLFSMIDDAGNIINISMPILGDNFFNWRHIALTFEDFGTRTYYRFYINSMLIESGFNSTFNNFDNFSIISFVTADEFSIAGIYISTENVLKRKDIIMLYSDGIVRNNSFLQTLYNSDLDYANDLNPRFDDQFYYRRS